MQLYAAEQRENVFFLYLVGWQFSSAANPSQFLGLLVRLAIWQPLLCVYLRHCEFYQRWRLRYDWLQHACTQYQRIPFTH